jgi:hypothetical protein
MKVKAGATAIGKAAWIFWPEDRAAGNDAHRKQWKEICKKNLEK